MKKYTEPVIKSVVITAAASIMQASLKPSKEGAFNLKGDATWGEYDGEEL